MTGVVLNMMIGILNLTQRPK